MLGAILPFADFTMHNNQGTGSWVLMMLGMVVFWGLLIFGVVWLVRRARGAEGGDAANPLAILDRRLADGQISIDEYDRRRTALRGGS